MRRCGHLRHGLYFTPMRRPSRILNVRTKTATIPTSLESSSADIRSSYTDLLLLASLARADPAGKALLRPKRLDRIHFRRAQRWHIRREERDRGEQRCCRDVYHRIERAHAEHQRREESRRQPSNECASDQPHSNEPRALPQHEAHHVAC